jgi:hypothetical protein
MRLHEKLLSRKRSIVETINDQLKNISQIEHSQGNVRGGCLHALCAVAS